MAHREHDRRDIDQQQDALHPDGLGQRDLDPGTGRQFRRSGEEHDRRKNPEARMPERFGHHLAKGDACGSAFGLREFVPHHPQAEHDARDRDQRDQRPPAEAGAEQQDAQQAADDDPERPPGVEDVEFSGLVLGVDRRGQRVDRAFGRAPAKAGHDHPGGQHAIDRVEPARRRCRQDQHRADYEAGGGEQKYPLGPDLVEQRADHQQAQRKTEEGVAQGGTDEFARTGRRRGIEQLALHRFGRAAADRVGERGAEQRQHADPEDRPMIVWPIGGP